MSVFTALTRSQSGIDGVQFEAVLESTFTASVEMTTYPLETNAVVADHAIFQPVEYTMTILASNNPLQPGVTDFIGGAISNFIPGLAGAAGAFTGLLSASVENTASAVLRSLVSAMVLREPVTITDGDITLSDMMITNISRTSNTENENGLECEITFNEAPFLDRVQVEDGSRKLVLDENDPSKTRAGGLIERGHASVRNAGDKIRTQAKNIFERLPGVTEEAGV